MPAAAGSSPTRGAADAQQRPLTHLPRSPYAPHTTDSWMHSSRPRPCRRLLALLARPPPRRHLTRYHAPSVTPSLTRRIPMIFRIAPAALAVLAVFDLAASRASPVTWAQHARRPPQNCTTARLCIAVPRLTECLGLGAGCAHAREDPKRSPSARPPRPSPLPSAPPPLPCIYLSTSAAAKRPASSPCIYLPNPTLPKRPTSAPQPSTKRPPPPPHLSIYLSNPPQASHLRDQPPPALRP